MYVGTFDFYKAEKYKKHLDFKLLYNKIEEELHEEFQTSCNDWDKYDWANMIMDFYTAPEYLINTNIISIEERKYLDSENAVEPLNDWAESYTWTFYIIKTSKFTMWMRWYGESNSWYSETVDIDYLHYDESGNLVCKTINL